MATMTMPTTTSAATTDKLINRFRTWADALQSKIDNACRPMTENPTPKRNCQYQRRLHEGRNLERTQKALRALADARESGTVPPELAELKTKNDIAELVRKGFVVLPYCNDDPVACQKLADVGCAAVQL